MPGRFIQNVDDERWVGAAVKTPAWAVGTRRSLSTSEPSTPSASVAGERETCTHRASSPAMPAALNAMRPGRSTASGPGDTGCGPISTGRTPVTTRVRTGDSTQPSAPSPWWMRYDCQWYVPGRFSQKS